jgi:predicted secreted hydrolase
MRTWLPMALVLALLAGGVVLVQGGRDRSVPGAGATISAVAAISGGDTVGFARALEVIPFSFPEDHGPHPEYRTEWWYLTGNLASPSGEAFGFQVTFFRNSLSPHPAGRSSVWDTNQLWMAHFALTDLEGGRHVTGERFARGAAGMAGAEASPFRVWLGDWELAGTIDDAFPMTIRALEEDARLELTAVTLKPPVLQGDRGLSRKGPEPGNASYYITWSRLDLTGTIEIAGQVHNVRGTGWMDREWSTSALGEEHVGWDWFSLQLDDGRDLMFFELRRDDGTQDPLNHGALVEADGQSRMLSAGEVRIEPLDWWESPVDGARYPSGWRLTVPDEALDLTITPRLRDQEMNLSFRYWEGAVAIEGDAGGRPVRGVGYVELTGYADEAGGRSGEDLR